MTYSELFSTYKKEISATVILYGIPSINRRLWWLLFFGATWIFGSIFVLDQNLFVGIVVGVGGFFPLRYLFFKRGKNNIKDLVNKYEATYLFKTYEKEDEDVLTRRIQLEKLKCLLGAKAKNTEYLKAIMQISKQEKVESSNEFSIRNLGVAAILLIVANNFFSVLFDYWKKNVDVYEIFDRTAVTICILIGCYGGYRLLKAMFISIINTDSYLHKVLFSLLEELEIEARFDLRK